MVSFMSSWLSQILDWLTLETTPLNSFLQGLVGACGISVLCNLMRVHLFIKDIRSSGDKTNSKDRSLHTSGSAGRLSAWLQFWFLTGILSLVGSRVASLVVLEFCLRAVSARFTAGPDSQSGSTQQFMVQCQFSLGCALSCSLHFLHEGAPQRLLSLLLTAGLSWLLASQSARLWSHVRVLYPLHSSQRYCGVCIGLLASGRALLPILCRALVLTFAVAAVAAVCTINRHFLSTTEALRFWTPLTICYTLLVVYMQDEQNRHPGGGTGRPADSDAGCLLPTQDLLDAVLHDSN
ncbi:hypothetical protein SKAU_G00110370 [Synaphobranchus kaupii]|uniref:Transmembrane protein 82 n=1 Tax=Synaphobranchus kaupii TaxID=118154 RepID=A0A9Q1G111_SYNKA|nr:hypothetical protein SKAU_G00110370 [Synaphobranchus kaupii]